MTTTALTVTLTVDQSATRAVVAALEQARRMIAPDRHTRAMAQAQAAGLTGLRDAYTANA